MANLCEHLLDTEEAGVSPLDCTRDELLHAAGEAGLALFDADLASVQDKGGFLAAVAQAIQAPDWFGDNWDALADVLGDFSWRDERGYVLLLRNGGETLGLGAAEHEVATEIFAEAADFWRSQGRPFWVLLG